MPQITHVRDEALSPLKVLLVKAYGLQSFYAAAPHSTLDSPFHDGKNVLPFQLEKLRSGLHRSTRFDHLDHHRLKSQGEPTVRQCPRNRRAVDPMIRASDPWHSPPKRGLEAHRIQMPPLPLGRMIVPVAGPPAFRTILRRPLHDPTPVPAPTAGLPHPDSPSPLSTAAGGPASTRRADVAFPSPQSLQCHDPCS